MTLIDFGTQQCQFCPKVASSRDGARDFFRCLPLTLMGEDSLISSLSRDTLSTNETHEKGNFDYWYIIIINTLPS